jgi:UDPglucose 6-dehydrogenase
MKIVVVGLGYVGLANALLLAKHYEVIGVDISKAAVDCINSKETLIKDHEILKSLQNDDLNIFATHDLELAVKGSDYVIISTPTNYNTMSKSFDTSTVEETVKRTAEYEPNTCIVIKSTIPVGFTDQLQAAVPETQIFFSPEFLREGKALYDNQYPSRIVVGSKTSEAKKFANIMSRSAKKENVEVNLTGSREAEAIKLISNSYLAMRVAFFNEVDNYAITGTLNSREIIQSVSSDPRIGKHYNNPSFGYGGYCLPKDTKQLLGNYANTPQNIIEAIVRSNETRKQFIAQHIINLRPNCVGIHRLIMKNDSDNFRQSSILDIIKILERNNMHVIIYEPEIDINEIEHKFQSVNLSELKSQSDIILANRMSKDLDDVVDKVFTRDLFNEN